MDTDGPSGQPDEDPDLPPEDRPAREPADQYASGKSPAETRTRQEYHDILTSGRGYEIIGFAALMAAQPAPSDTNGRCRSAGARSTAVAWA